MDSTITQNHKNVAAIIHASTFSKYLIPFGNFLLPLVLWMSNKKDSPFVEHHGKQAINFQVSLLLYGIVLGILAVPLTFFTTWDFIGFTNFAELNAHTIDLSFRNFFNIGEHLVLWGVFGIIALSLFLLNVICTIIAAMRAHDGIEYRYPLTIPFLK